MVPEVHPRTRAVAVAVLHRLLGHLSRLADLSDSFVDSPTRRSLCPSTPSAIACPQIHEDAFVHPDAVVIGDVRIGARVVDLARGPSFAATTAPSSSGNGRRSKTAAVIHAVDGYPDRGRQTTASSVTSRTSKGASCTIARSWAAARSCCTRPSSTAGRPSPRARSCEIAWSVPEGAMAVGVPAQIKLRSCSDAEAVAAARRSTSQRPAIRESCAYSRTIRDRDEPFERRAAARRSSTLALA